MSVLIKFHRVYLLLYLDQTVITLLVRLIHLLLLQLILRKPLVLGLNGRFSRRVPLLRKGNLHVGSEGRSGRRVLIRVPKGFESLRMQFLEAQMDFLPQLYKFGHCELLEVYFIVKERNVFGAPFHRLEVPQKAALVQILTRPLVLDIVGEKGVFFGALEDDRKGRFFQVLLLKFLVCLGKRTTLLGERLLYFVVEELLQESVFVQQKAIFILGLLERLDRLGLARGLLVRVFILLESLRDLLQALEGLGHLLLMRESFLELGEKEVFVLEGVFLGGEQGLVHFGGVHSVDYVLNFTDLVENRPSLGLVRSVSSVLGQRMEVFLSVAPRSSFFKHY